ncbi:hypothetical protein A5792_10110 [Mycolicibacterium peregrinum]|uniref:Acyl-CoA dehydrogenase/oxidase N-terminal domain-containing protein n=1 Tax=Mycolicibacterium peregrinum TaxID=43304 RepID=A0A1A0RGP4_MYCPR|nr:hypothetical protein A5792_10110 [Mycolicibacterium peregrinum]
MLYESATLRRELAKEFGKLGVLGMHLQGYGCAGTNAVGYGLACMELWAGDSGFRSFVSVQGSLSMFSIYPYGSEEQKNEWPPRLAAVGARHRRHAARREPGTTECGCGPGK